MEIEVRGLRTPTFDLAMPAWTPADYRIRDYARNVQEFSSETAKNQKLMLRNSLLGP